MSPKTQVQAVLRSLAERGILLEADGKYPSVVELIAGEKIAGSWWGHAAGKLIFNTCELLLDQEQEVVRVKLLFGKRTYVHRRLWSELVAIGSSGAAWQRELDVDAKKLLAAVERGGALRLDELTPALAKLPKPTALAAALEAKLLAIGSSIHTESGAHAKGLESWAGWAKRIGFSASVLPPDVAQASFEREAAAQGMPRTKKTFPWPMAGR